MNNEHPEKSPRGAGRARYRKLLEPFQLKHLRLKNRIVKSPYSSTNSDDRGYILESAVDHYDAIARGGVGLFITESVAITPLGMSGTPRMAIWDDSYIPGQRRLVETVHKYDVPILMQLQHAGPAYSTGAYGGATTAAVERLVPRAASALTREQLPGPRPNLPQALTAEEISELVQQYTRAAERARDAGFDGVELNYCGGYLMNSFFSRAWNKRADEYGGTIENRVRFGAEVIRSMRKSLGDKFIIDARYNAVEMGARHDDGISEREGCEIGRLLEAAGADMLHVNYYGYNYLDWVVFPEQAIYPEVPAGMEAFAQKVHRCAPFVDTAAAVKAGVSIPVIAVGKLNFDSAERALREGKADLAAFGRALIADPDAPNKLRDGLYRDIRPCTHCVTCIDAFLRSAHERCRVNAAFAQEKELQIIPAIEKKRVLVIGGGPSGMEAARVAALRGHSVTLCDSQPRLGGLVPLASLIKSTDVEDLPPFIAYLERQLKKLGVDVRRGTTVDLEMVRRLAPDAVVVATGSKLKVPDIPGLDRKIVVTSSDLQAQVALPQRLLSHSMLEWATKIWLPLGKRVVLIGGLMQGAELAEFLVKRGRHVVMTDTSDELGTGLLQMHRKRHLRWLAEKGCTLLAGVTYDRITDKGLSLITKEGQSRFFEADSVLVVSVREADYSLYEALRRIVRETTSRSVKGRVLYR